MRKKENGCEGKKKYETAGEAKAAMRRMKRIGMNVRRRLSHYRCPFCAFYHVGNDSAWHCRVVLMECGVSGWRADVFRPGEDTACREFVSLTKSGATDAAWRWIREDYARRLGER